MPHTTQKDCRSPYSPSTSSSETSSLSCSPASLLVHGRDTAATLKSNVRLRETLRAPQCHLERSRMDPNPTHSTKNISCRPSFSQITPFSLLVLVCFAFLCLPQNAESCSSRSTPKPRPPSQSAIRPNITFQTYACPPAYAAWYCLNGATCFTVKIADSILYNCECADGYMGQRCEFKDLDGTYLPTRERFLMLRNSRVGQAMILVLTIVITAVIISAIVTKMRTRSKLRNLAAEAAELQQQNQYRMSGDSIFSIGMSESSVPGRDVMGQSISYQLSASCHDNSPYQLWPRRPDQNVPRIRGNGTSVLMDETSFCNQRTSLSSSSASLTTARRAPMMQSRIS